VKKFLLVPHPESPAIKKLNGLQLTGTYSFEQGIISISYELTGPLEKIVIPQMIPSPGRKDNLWKTTCFEVFLKPLNENRYWEFNISPTGDWNVYSFISYRQDMCEESIFAEPLISIKNTADCLRVSLIVDFSQTIIANGILKTSFSSVVEFIDGGLIYYALVHPGDEPDFHHPENFIIKL